MGAKCLCTQLKPKNIEASFFYIDRIRNKMLLIYKGCAFSKELNNGIIFNKDSALAYKKNFIFIAGGQLGSEGLSSLFIMINTKDFTINHLASLPIASKLGYLQPYKNKLVYAGGISVNPLSKKKQLSPVMVYDLLKNNWEIFNQFNIKSSKIKISINDLKKPGCFVSSNKLIMFGGYYIRGNKREPNQNIFSFELKSLNQPPAIFKNKSVLNIYCPMTQGYKNKALIAGGKYLDSTRNNKVFLFKYSSFHELPGLMLDQSEHYPILIRKHLTLIFSFPNAYIKIEDSSDWKTLTLNNSGESQETQKNEAGAGKHSKQGPSQELLKQTELSRSQSIISIDTPPLAEPTPDLVQILNAVPDDQFAVPAKKTLKVILLCKKTLDKEKVNPLFMSNLISTISTYSSISILNIQSLLSDYLSNSTYTNSQIFPLISSIHVPLGCSRVEAKLFLSLVELLSIPTSADFLSKSQLVVLLSTLIKFLLINS